MIEIPKDIFADVPSKCKECNHNTTKWLIDHDKQIRDEVISEIINKINHIGYVPVCVDCLTKHNLIEMLEQLKGEQNE